MNNHEARHPSGLSHHQGRDDRRHRIHHAHDLGQGRRYAASRYRPKVAPGVDRRAAATCRPRRTPLALPEEICRTWIKKIGAFLVARVEQSETRGETSPGFRFAQSGLLATAKFR